MEPPTTLPERICNMLRRLLWPFWKRVAGKPAGDLVDGVHRCGGGCDTGTRCISKFRDPLVGDETRGAKTEHLRSLGNKCFGYVDRTFGPVLVVLLKRVSLVVLSGGSATGAVQG